VRFHTARGVLKETERVIPSNATRDALKEAECAYNDARRFGLPLDFEMVRALRQLIIRLARRRMVLIATALVYDMLSAGARPNSPVIYSLIEAYAHYKDMEGARQLFQMLREHGVEIDNRVYGAMIVYHTKLDDVHSARDVYEEGKLSDKSDQK